VVQQIQQKYFGGVAEILEQTGCTLWGRCLHLGVMPLYLLWSLSFSVKPVTQPQPPTPETAWAGSGLLQTFPWAYSQLGGLHNEAGCICHLSNILGRVLNLHLGPGVTCPVCSQHTLEARRKENQARFCVVIARIEDR
jgi:hypothetical protein